MGQQTDQRRHGVSPSIAKIEHNFSDPSLLSLHNVSFGHDGQPAVMVAKTVNLGLSLSLFNQPLRFASIELRDGTLDAANMPGNMAWPLQADRLQLRNMAVNTPRLAISAKALNGGIIPGSLHPAVSPATTPASR